MEWVGVCAGALEEQEKGLTQSEQRGRRGNGDSEVGTENVRRIAKKRERRYAESAEFAEKRKASGTVAQRAQREERRREEVGCMGSGRPHP